MLYLWFISFTLTHKVNRKLNLLSNRQGADVIGWWWWWATAQQQAFYNNDINCEHLLLCFNLSCNIFYIYTPPYKYIFYSYDFLRARLELIIVPCLSFIVYDTTLSKRTCDTSRYAFSYYILLLFLSHKICFSTVFKIIHNWYKQTYINKHSRNTTHITYTHTHTQTLTFVWTNRKFVLFAALHIYIYKTFRIFNETFQISHVVSCVWWYSFLKVYIAFI